MAVGFLYFHFTLGSNILDFKRSEVVHVRFDTEWRLNISCILLNRFERSITWCTGLDSILIFPSLGHQSPNLTTFILMNFQYYFIQRFIRRFKQFVFELKFHRNNRNASRRPFDRRDDISWFSGSFFSILPTLATPLNANEGGSEMIPLSSSVPLSSRRKSKAFIMLHLDKSRSGLNKVNKQANLAQPIIALY